MNMSVLNASKQQHEAQNAFCLATTRIYCKKRVISFFLKLRRLQPLVKSWREPTSLNTAATSKTGAVCTLNTIASSSSCNPNQTNKQKPHLNKHDNPSGPLDALHLQREKTVKMQRKCTRSADAAVKESRVEKRMKQKCS